ncbi:MAG: ArsR family transcriptional regulator, partial [Candidatus Heteroscillospira sp.]
MASTYEMNARIFKAFCDENRLRILELLRSGEKCACKLLEDLN